MLVAPFSFGIEQAWLVLFVKVDFRNILKKTEFVESELEDVYSDDSFC